MKECGAKVGREGREKGRVGRTVEIAGREKWRAGRGKRGERNSGGGRYE